MKNYLIRQLSESLLNELFDNPSYLNLLSDEFKSLPIDDIFQLCQLSSKGGMIALYEGILLSSEIAFLKFLDEALKGQGRIKK